MLPAHDWKECQASSVTTPVSVRNPTLKHVVGLTEYRASRYFGRLPTNTAETGSLSLCTSNFLWLPSDPTVASDALAIRITFPSVGVALLSFKQTGLLASPSKQKNPHHF